jgi:N-hydroxyarylamine O-acetyltransferase
VQLERRTGIGIDKAFEKIVSRGRGGWCYEMNGLLGWAREEIGFEVIYMSGGVARSTRGDSALGNHLVLLARLMARSD